PESLVALAIRRSLDIVVGIYAVIKAGGAYVPVDPDHPAERIGHILDTANPVCVLSTSRDGFEVPGDRSAVHIDTLDYSGLSPAPVTDADRIARLAPEHPAYVIFTSGSTGKPKGVAVSHAAIANQIAWMLTEYPLGASDVYLQKTATTFDVSLWGFFMPLRVGAQLVVATPDGHRDPAYVAATIRELGVTVTDFVPSMLTVFAGAAAAADLESLRYVFVIGEALPAETVRDFASVCDAGVHNLYGPTEAAVSITYADVTGTEVGGAVSIGRPEWNSRVYVLDSRLRAVPAGVPGELYLAGVQLARGYYGRVDLTSDRFVANPYGDNGARMYRTGDLVCWRANGELEYIGRTDFQVKFRGQRIELGEIETALLAHESVLQSAVLVVQTATGDQLVGYVVPAPGAAIEVDGLREFAAGLLPSYMMPSALMVLDAFPLNPSGKLDRKALPAPVFETREFRAPSTAAEVIVAGVFAEVLGIERVGLDDDFFELGGNSLVATQAAARLGAALDTRVPVRELFEATTVEALAARVQPTAGLGGRTALTAKARPDRLPLSLAQTRMWFLNRFDADSAVNNIPVAVRMSGQLDEAALQAAVADVVARHEVLRTVYPERDGVGSQVILPVGQAVPDITPETVAETDLFARIVEVVTAGFDVTAHVPVRATLLRVTSTEHVLVLVVHHITGDAFSVGPLTRDVMVAYTSRAAGLAPDWAPMPVQYADYALWQREVLGSEDDSSSLISQQLAYWADTLRGLPEQLDLPSDRPRPAVASNRGAGASFTMDADLHRRLGELARANNVTLFMVVHAALSVLLARLSGTEDIAIGTPVAGRGEAALDDMIGMFVNTLVLRSSIESGSSFEDLLGRTREGDLSAFAHADVPFERLVEVLSPERSQARHPLFQVVLSFQNLAPTRFELPGLTLSGVEADAAVAKFDLQVTVSESVDADGAPAGMTAHWIYATDLFDEATVHGFGERLTRILRAVGDDPSTALGDLEVLSGVERADLTTRRGGEAIAARPLGQMLAAAAALDPSATAISFAGHTLAYEELDHRSSRLARLLIARGIGAEDVVAIAIPRSDLSVIAVWAVAKTGAAFVPVDPNYPADRVEHMITDSGAVIGLTVGDKAGNLPAAARWLVLDDVDVLARIHAESAGPLTADELVRPVHVDQQAYVIYTSGSTGKPKGVVVTHAGVANFCEEQRRRYGLSDRTRALHVASPSFDASVLELLLAIGAGGTLVIAPP
ncbi:amino acid adenylation domain-containing protein, partial [Rhodococcus sp. NPDC058514]|uniref:amino acid adenylation domain-containing protein n=1 Tax=Rhodococcus sp. NPDC058514 TaxID=3346532 RepID=UPI00365463F8